MDKYSKWLALISSQLATIEELLNLLVWGQAPLYPAVINVYDEFESLIDL